MTGRSRSVIAALATTVGLSVLTGPVAASGGMMGGGAGAMGGLGGFVLGPLLWLLLLGVGVALVAGSVRGSSNGSGPDRDTAISTLRERYARGEITRETFERRREELSRR